MKKNKINYKVVILVTLILMFFIQIVLNNKKGFNFISEGLFIQIPNITTQADSDQDGINDIEDILSGARQEIKNKTNYKSAYYVGGYPPEDEGVCTDVIRRALENAGFDLKSMVDEDIAKYTKLYPRVNGSPDPNIDFRRVPNLKVFFDRKAISLTTEVKPGDKFNLSEWQPGDIVIFGKPKYHIAIISDKRNRYGVPYMIHNSAPVPREDNWLVYWNESNSLIIGHYRLKYNSFAK